MMVKCVIRDLMQYLLATTLLHKAYHLCCDYAVPLGSFLAKSLAVSSSRAISESDCEQRLVVT